MQRWFFVESEENARLRIAGDIEEEALDIPLKEQLDFTDRKSWLFNVQVDEIRPGEVVCVTGGCDILGNWVTEKCVPLSLDHDTNTWSRTISLPQIDCIEYRYCICTILDTQQHVIVRRWETHIRPRRILKQSMSPTLKSEPDLFGHINNVVKIERGWLSQDNVIQLKLYNNPITIWKPKLGGRTLYIKLTPINLNRHHPSICSETLEESQDTQEFVEPPPHSVAEVASLKSEDCSFALQEQFGTQFGSDDYLIFQISVLQLQSVAYLFDFYVYSTHVKDGDPPYHVGFGYLLPGALKNSDGHTIVPITTVKHRPLGQLSIEYLIVSPLKESSLCDMQASYARHWKHSRSCLDVAHRGLGSNFVDTKRCAEVRENTIASLKTAASHGADFVEFDVQLSKDLVPIIYHDFHVCISMKRKKQLDDTDMMQLPVKELTLEQLHLLKVYHLEEGKDKNPRFFDDHLEEHQPFPTLQQILEILDPHVGFNIEVKWTMQLQDGSYELLHPIDLNVYLDQILSLILRHAGKRRIIFSSFNPDICAMIRLKQNKYPVMFLTQGETHRYPSYHDPRCLNIKSAVQHATASELLGVSVHTEDILRDCSQVKLALDANLVVFCWGNDNNDPATIKYLKKLGLHGVIYDKIDEYSGKEIKESIFMIEARESQRKEFIVLAASQAESQAQNVINEITTTNGVSVPIYPSILNIDRTDHPGASTATSLESLVTLDNYKLIDNENGSTSRDVIPKTSELTTVST